MAKEFTELYENLVETTLGIVNNPGNWISFLKAAAWQYKYRFEDKVMIYHQRPDAKACASLKLWNRLGRWVKKGAKGIALINDSSNRNTLRHVFDISDTTSRGHGNPTSIWSMQESYEQRVIDMLENTFGYLQNRSDFVSAVISATDNASMDNQKDYLDDLLSCREGSLMEDLDEEYTEVLFRQAIKNSVAYMTLIRCGFDADMYFASEDFAGVVNFGTLNTVCQLGAATSDIAEVVIRNIEQTAKGIKKEERNISKRVNDKKEKEGIGKNDELQERGRLSDARYRVANGDNSDRKIRNAAQDLLEGAQERDVLESDVVRKARESFDRNRPDSKGADRADDFKDGTGRGRDRRIKSPKPNEMGWSDERYTAISRGSDSKRTDIQLNKKDEQKASGDKLLASLNEKNTRDIEESELYSGQQISLFELHETQRDVPDGQISNSRTFLMPQSIIDEALCLGGNEPCSMERICSYFSKDYSLEQNATFLKKEYGQSGKGFFSGIVQYSIWFDENGIRIAMGRSAHSGGTLLTWEETAKRIRELLDMGRYVPKTILYKAPANERMEISEQLWYIVQDFSKEAREENFIPTILEIYNNNRGFENNTEQIVRMLNNDQKISDLISEVKAFYECYSEKPSLMRFRFRYFDEFLPKLNDLLRPSLTFSVDPTFSFEPKHFITDDEIDALLIGGGNIQYSKFRIYSYFLEEHTPKERITFLKHEYGSGGWGHSGSNEYHDSKGISYSREDASFKPYDKILLKWNRVEKRIRDLIKHNRYMLDKELDYIPIYEKRVLAREIHGFFMGVSQEIEHPYPFGLDIYEATKILEKHLEDSKKVEDIYQMMSSVLENTSQEDQHYEYQKKVFANLSAFRKGTFSLFGEKKQPIVLLSKTDKQFDDPGEVSNLHKKKDIKETESGDKYDFRIVNDRLGYGTPKVKYEANISAIRLLKQIEIENRFATPAEQEVLTHYVGWGGIAQAFDEKNNQWTKEYKELKELLTPGEYKSARESILNAYYTSPTVIKAIYHAIENMGFKTGNVLEPACGVGNFFGLIPDGMKGSKLYGVELDSITGRLAKQLYQNANIFVQGFEKTELPDSFFDLAISNIPFGSYGVTDQRYDKHKFYIHDYFFAKTLDKVRPGGIIAFVTSKGTMDKQNQKVRKYIAQRAELIGAVRLPNNAFLANAGTEVTADILFLQKRDRVIDIEPDWIHLSLTDDNLPINQYFADHPNMMLGKMSIDSGHRMYGSATNTTCIPHEGMNLAEALETAMQNVQAEIIETDMEVDSEVKDTSIPADPDVRNFSFCIVDGKIYYRENSRMNLISTSGIGENRIRGMMAIRDCVRELINYQTENYSEDVIKASQIELNRLYDDYSKKYGLLNSRANKLVFVDDSSYSLLCSLENLDDEGNFKSKAAMFTKRTIRQHATVEHVDTAAEALALSIAEKACVDMDYMSELTGIPAEQIASDLQGVIFRKLEDDEHAVPEEVQIESFDLESRPFVTADEYLSGDVRNKLKLAKDLADKRPDLADQLLHNIHALEKAQPKDLDASEISVRLGATWIPTDVIKDFVFEQLETPELYRRFIDVRYSKYSAEWNIKGKSADRSDNIKANVSFGSNRISAYKIIEDSLNLRDVRIFDTVREEGQERRVLNKKETQIAQQSQAAIKEAFQNWIWKDPQRRERLTGIYNERYNSIRPREYDGIHITFANMNPEITLRNHQVNGAARGIYGGNTLLAHVVGAGKTYTMTAIAMESKRLGLCNKSLFVVPNHLTEQWGADFLQLYPSANILVSTKKDFEKQNRRKFCARIATGDYDAVIIGHSQFEKIPISDERQKRLIEDQIDEISYGIQDLFESDGERYAIKQMEKTKKNLEVRLHRLNETKSKDDVVTFEELGVDRLFVDEADNFKNLFLYTKMRNVAGLSQTDAKKSSDMYAKCRYMDDLTDGRGIVFATGTPISNSIAEMFTLQRYLQYTLLSQKQLQHFDCWASTFGETVTAIELAPEGTGYRTKTRFARFYNLPELMNMFREVADIQTADMLNLPVPEAHYLNVAVKPSETQREMVLELGDRADQVRNRLVEPYEDNMLKITNDGRKVALDQRLMNPLLPDFEGSKVNECVRNVYRIWKEKNPQKLTQLIFCDMSTPKKRIEMEHKKDQFISVYNDAREKLIEIGVPDNEIAFIHDAHTDLQKKDMFAKVRSGKIRILFGSTAKMGAGTNVQDNLIAIHDLDCPWRPRDLEQRAGRIVRQGNKNKEVYIYRYVTEQTFDSYLYQILENKQKFISQVMTSKSALRSAEDIDETALSYAEVKALAAGNPLIKEKMQLDIDVTNLKVLKANHQSQHFVLEDKVVKYYPEDIRRTEARISGMKEDWKVYAKHKKERISEDEKGSIFAGMTVKGMFLSEKAAAGTAILESCKVAKELLKSREIGEYMGFKMILSFDNYNSNFELQLKRNSIYNVVLGKDVLGNISRINHALDSIPESIKLSNERMQTLNHQMKAAKEQLEVPFEKEDELQSKITRLAELNVLLNMDHQERDIDEVSQEIENDIKTEEEVDVENKELYAAYDAVIRTGKGRSEIENIIER